MRLLPYSTPGNLFMALEHRAKYWEEGVHYAAVSYVHGDMSERKPITLAGRSFMITEGLYDALAAIHARGGGDRWFWIDQLCINHQNLAEKNAQVAQMSVIYASADQVVAWLRPEVDSIANGQAKAGTQAEVEEVAVQGGEADSNGTLKVDMSAVAHNLYWQRAWTRVEALRARRLAVMYGQHVINNDKLQHLYSSASEQDQPFKTLLQRILGSESDTCNEQMGPSEILHQVLGEYSVCSSSNVLDRVFAMLNDPRLEKLPSARRPRIDYGITAAELVSGLTVWHDEWLTYEYMTKSVQQASLDFSRLASNALDTALG